MTFSRTGAVLAVALALLSGACTSAATTAPTVAGQAAATQTAAHSGATAGKWCSDVHIAFFAGGPAGGVFAVNVYNGAVQAQADLGPKVDYEFSNWDPQTMLQQFREVLAMKPDGIAVMGHPGDAAFGPLIAQAEQAGIIVTSQNDALPKTQAKYAAAGFGFVGADQYQSGYDLGTAAVKEFNLQKGDRTMVWGFQGDPVRGVRTQGVIDALKAAGMTVDSVVMDQATSSDPVKGIPTFVGYVSSHPDVKLIVTDHAAATSLAQQYMQAANKTAGSIGIAGFDLSPATVSAIEGGWVGLVADQQEWLQGYLPILQICLTKKYGFSGLNINTGGGMVDKSNVAAIAPLVAKNIR